MRGRWSLIVVHVLLCSFALGTAQAANKLSLATGLGELGDPISIPLRLTTTDEVQGLVAVFGWTSTEAVGIDLIVGELLAEADTVVRTVESDHIVLGVIMDSDPFDNEGIAEIIGPGDDLLLATAVLECLGMTGAFGVNFVDGTFPAAAGGPLLDNVVVVGGLSIGFDEGLVLEDGSLICAEALDKFIVESGSNQLDTPSDRPGDIRILMNNTGEVEGFVTSVCHKAGVTLEDIELGADAAQADFSATEIDPLVGGALGVVIDLVDPMQMPPNIEPGRGRHIATYSYSCLSTPIGGEPDIVVDLELCDNQIGDPLKENLIVVNGLSRTTAEGLVLENGTFTCGPTGPRPETERGLCDDGIDNDGDGLIDGDDPDCQMFDFEVVDPETLEPTSLSVAIGNTARGLLAFHSPTRAALGIPDTSDGGVLIPGSAHVPVQGFSLGFAYDCDEVAALETFDVSGTILDILGAEFAQVQADNDPDDGDGCSMILAVLVDALPPFDGAAIPGLPETQPLGVLEFQVSETLDCSDRVVIVAQDGLAGPGTVPVRNLISVESRAFRTSARPIEIEIVERGKFFRGDCNFSLRDDGLDPINIADAAAVLSFPFQLSSLKFDPPCVDACDANDDGRIDLGDAVEVLLFLFVPGSEFPPAPGPGFDDNLNPTIPGIDPTPDLLDCVAGTVCDQ